MGRRKVNHELISDESARKVTFKKRKAGLLKKLKELTTLCGVAACAVIFSAYTEQPEVWPSPSEASCVLEKFKKMPAKKQQRNMVDQEVFLMKNISKLNEKLERTRKKNRRLKLETILGECSEGKDSYDVLSLSELNELSLLVNEKIRFIDENTNENSNYVKFDEVNAKNEKKE